MGPRRGTYNFLDVKLEKLFIPGVTMMVLPSLLGWLLPPIAILALIATGFLCAAVALFACLSGHIHELAD